jgi:hypothetical protein
VSEQRLGGHERKVEREFARRDVRLVAIAGARERPVVDESPCRFRLDPREAESRARRALVVVETAVPRIGERRMREHELPRRERASIRLGNARPVAKERDLHTPLPARGVPDPAGGVPPLGAKLRVGAVIARKHERARLDARVVDLGQRAVSGRQQGKRKEAAPLHAHQSSLTPSTTSSPSA